MKTQNVVARFIQQGRPSQSPVVRFILEGRAGK